MQLESKTHISPLLATESPVAQCLEHPTRSRRDVASNPIWGSDFSEFPVDSINISFHMCISFSHSLTKKMVVLYFLQFFVSYSRISWNGDVDDLGLNCLLINEDNVRSSSFNHPIILYIEIPQNFETFRFIIIVIVIIIIIIIVLIIKPLLYFLLASGDEEDEDEDEQDEGSEEESTASIVMVW